MPNFTEAVKQMMAEKGITVAKLAKKTGYSWAYINDLLKGRRRWNEETMKKASKAVGLVITYQPRGLEPTGTDGQ
ncbi:MAG: hypothetical protein JL56_05765 [Desulfotomaculum sp. BICA1-6]|nr:MAG: hypothetical protein JL56_05765 [Desulfotomaculum sp. BICA1-6]